MSIFETFVIALLQTKRDDFARYILGSGGTLMFDITIVTQSFLYRPKAHLRGRRASRTFEEEEGLLGAGATGSDDPITPSRRRNLTQSEVRD